MEIIFTILLFYTIASAVVEAGLKTIERIYVGIRAIMKVERKQAVKEWAPFNKFLMVIFSIALVFAVNISIIDMAGRALLHAVPGIEDGTHFTAGWWGMVLTGLMIARGSNFVHNFIEKVKLWSRR